MRFTSQRGPCDDLLFPSQDCWLARVLLRFHRHFGSAAPLFAHLGAAGRGSSEPSVGVGRGWRSQWPGQFLSWCDFLGLSENRVYSQWNSHLIGIMISKTIGFRGTLFWDTPFWLDFPVGSSARHIIPSKMQRKQWTSRTVLHFFPCKFSSYIKLF